MAYYGCASGVNQKRWKNFACFAFIAVILLIVGALTVSYGGKENNITGGVFLALSGAALVVAAVPLVLMAVRAQPPESSPTPQKVVDAQSTV